MVNSRRAVWLALVVLAGGCASSSSSTATGVTISARAVSIVDRDLAIEITIANHSPEAFPYSSFREDTAYPVVQFRTFAGWKSFETQCDTDTTVFRVPPGQTRRVRAATYLAFKHRTVRVGLQNPRSGEVVWSQPFSLQPALGGHVVAPPAQPLVAADAPKAARR